jgi:hypothetical protein
VADETTTPSMDDTMTRVMADMAEREKTTEPTETPVQTEEQPSASSEAAPSGDRPRGPDGKFIPKDSAAPEAAAAAQTTVRAEPTATAAPATAPSGPPESWTADAKANIWPQLTPTAQAEILRREKAVTDGLAQKSAELKEYEPLKSILGPRQHLLAAEYGSVANGLQTLFSLSEFAAKDAPGFVKWFAQQRGIDLSSLAGTPAGQPQVSADPDIAALQQEIAALKQNLGGFTQQQEQAQQAELNRQIEAFKADPKNAHFETVRGHMAALMQGGQARDLQEAYDMAVHANPQTRALVTEEQRKADQAKREAEQARAVAEAKRQKETNVATTGALGASPTKPRSWEETMAETAKRLNAA